MCDDSREETFETDLDEPNKYQRCTWLKTRPAEQPKYCDPDHPAGAYDLCEETCGKCTDDCEDTTDFFIYKNVTRRCKWLELRVSVMDEVCQEGFTAYDSVCPETCDSCDRAGTTRPPTPVPTSSPQPSPSPSRLPSHGPTTHNPTTLTPTTSSPSHTPIRCDDDFDFQFVRESDGRRQYCYYLVSRPEERAIYCDPDHSSGVYDACEETCGKCTDDCEDTNGYFTYVHPKSGDTTLRDCVWLGLRRSVQAEVCKEGYTAYDTTCPELCGQCDVPAPDAPTTSPSVSIQPTMKPSYNCQDTDGTFTYTGDGTTRNCVWLSEQNIVLRGDVCQEGFTVYDVTCPETCGACDEPSSQPSPSPSRTPSASPSQTPSVYGACDDDMDATFFLNHEPDQTPSDPQTCLWLSLNAPSLTQTTLCDPSHPSGAYDVCEETCGKCTDECVDTDGTFPYQGVQRSCSWLMGSPSVRELICFPGYTAHDITCPETCNACDDEDGVSSS